LKSITKFEVIVGNATKKKKSAREKQREDLAQNFMKMLSSMGATLSS